MGCVYKPSKSIRKPWLSDALLFVVAEKNRWGKTFSFDRYTDAVRSAYKPHRDTGNSEEQREVLQKKIASFEKEFGKSTSLSFTEMKRQIDTVISLAVECIGGFVRPLSANSSNRDRHLVLNEVTILAI